MLNKNEYDRSEQVMRDADIAMYHAKSASKARYVRFDQKMHRNIVDRMQLGKDLRQAVGRMEFILHYQPIVSLSTWQLYGF